MSDTQPDVDGLRSLMARAGADEETIEQIMQQGVCPCITQAKKDLLAEVDKKVVLPVVDYLADNGHYPIEADIRTEIYERQTAAIKEIEEGL